MEITKIIAAKEYLLSIQDEANAESISTALRALNSQLPMKIIRKNHFYQYEELLCPVCGTHLYHSDVNSRCPKCGQQLIWADTKNVVNSKELTTSKALQGFTQEGANG